MTTTLSQLWGIICYEMRLQWRRRSLLIIVISFALLMLGFMLIQRQSMRAIGARELPLEMATFSVLLSLSPIGLLVMMIALPPVLAETIPRDRQVGMAELLAAQPISSGFYLTGKVLGVWGSILMMVVVVAILGAVVARFTFGPFDIGSYLSVWLLGILPLALFVSATTVLLASRQPSRRRATMVGGAFTMYCVMLLPLVTGAYAWWQAFIPSAWLQVVFRLVFDYLGSGLADSGVTGIFPEVPLRFVWQTLAAAVLQLAVVWTAVTAWWRRAEGKEW